MKRILAAMLLFATPAMSQTQDDLEYMVYAKASMVAQRCGVQVHPWIHRGVREMAKRHHMMPVDVAGHLDEAGRRLALRYTTEQIAMMCMQMVEIYRDWDATPPE